MFGGAISWMSKQKGLVALSTIEAEYMIVTHACKEAIWIKQIMIYCSSQSAIYLAKNPIFHARTQHIDVQFHFIRDMVEDDFFFILWQLL